MSVLVKKLTSFVNAIKLCRFAEREKIKFRFVPFVRAGPQIFAKY